MLTKLLCVLIVFSRGQQWDVDGEFQFIKYKYSLHYDLCTLCEDSIIACTLCWILLCVLDMKYTCLYVYLEGLTSKTFLPKTFFFFISPLSLHSFIGIIFDLSS